jgi:hypothetical protein
MIGLSNAAAFCGPVLMIGRGTGAPPVKAAGNVSCVG